MTTEKRITDLTDYTSVLPCASEVFGVYQSLLGWKSKKQVQLVLDRDLSRQLRQLVYEQERYNLGALWEHTWELLDDPERMARVMHYGEGALWNAAHITYGGYEPPYGHKIGKGAGDLFGLHGLQEQLHLDDEAIKETRGEVADRPRERH